MHRIALSLLVIASATLLTCGPSAVAMGQMAITPSVPPPPPSVGPNARNFGPWPVGLWKPANLSCKGNEGSLSLGKNGRLGAARWRIAGNRITVTQTIEGPDDTADTVRYAPVRTRTMAIKKLTESRMTLDGGAWKRCSRDPDEYFS